MKALWQIRKATPEEVKRASTILCPRCASATQGGFCLNYGCETNILGEHQARQMKWGKERAIE